MQDTGNRLIPALDVALSRVASLSGKGQSSLIDFRHQVSRWLNHSGMSWTVKRLKTLKVWALQVLAGKDEFSSPWFRHRTFRGVLIPNYLVFQVLVEARDSHNPKLAQAVLDTLNVYHVIPGPDINNINKIIDNIVEPIYATHESEWIEILITGMPPVLKKVHHLVREKPLSFPFQGPDNGGSKYALSPGKNSWWFNSLIPSVQYIPEWLFSYDLSVINWMKGSPLFSSYAGFIDAVLAKPRQQFQSYWAGNLSTVPATGLKTRLVAIGSPWIQGLLRPMKDYLFRLLKQLPTDCTFDQCAGVEWGLGKLKAGSKVYSVDLSAATDNFPFSLQAAVADYVGVPTHLIALLKYGVFSYKGRNVMWRNGQGMGLYPSFPLFALTHNLILHALAVENKLDPAESYRILGDDVIISDERLYNDYCRFLTSYEIPVSKEKTMISSILFEFAGHIVWRQWDITPIKWKQITPSSVTSPLYLEYKSRNLLKFSKDGHIKSSFLVDPSSVLYLEALRPLPIRLGGFGEFTNIPLDKRLRLGNRKVKGIRAGHLTRVGDRVQEFLNGTYRIPQIDWDLIALNASSIPTFRVLLEEEIEKLDLQFAGPFAAQFPSNPIRKQEALRSLQSLTSREGTGRSTSELARLWHIAELSPNSLHEFNRMLTHVGKKEVVDVLVPAIGGITKLSPTKWRNPSHLDDLYVKAQERIDLLVKQVIPDPEEIVELSKKQTNPLWKVVGGVVGTKATVAAFRINPLLGLSVGGLTLLALLTSGNKDTDESSRVLVADFQNP